MYKCPHIILHICFPTFVRTIGIMMDWLGLHVFQWEVQTLELRHHQSSVHLVLILVVSFFQKLHNCYDDSGWYWAYFGNRTQARGLVSSSLPHFWWRISHILFGCFAWGYYEIGYNFYWISPHCSKQTQRDSPSRT